MCCSFLLTCFQKKCTRQLDGPRWSVLNKPRMRYVNKNATCKISFQGEKSLLKVHPRHQVLGRLTAFTPLLGQRSIHPSQRRENKIWINAVVCGASPPLYLHAGITRSRSISLIIFCHFRLCSMKLGRHFFPLLNPEVHIVYLAGSVWPHSVLWWGVLYLRSVYHFHMWGKTFPVILLHAQTRSKWDTMASLTIWSKAFRRQHFSHFSCNQAGFFFLFFFYVFHTSQQIMFAPQTDHILVSSGVAKCQPDLPFHFFF